jgi:hypothetical protein
MVDIPSPADLFAFAVMFFPGFISMQISLRLNDNPSDRPDAVEKLVISFVLSVVAFYLAAVPIDPLHPAVTVLSIDNLIRTFLVAIGLGLVVSVLYYGWLYVEVLITSVANWVRSKTGLTIAPGTALERGLDAIWRYRKNHYVIIKCKDGSMFKGFLAIFSSDPTLQIVLSQFDEKTPMQRFDAASCKWSDIEEWTMIFTQEDISTIAAISK